MFISEELQEELRGIAKTTVAMSSHCRREAAEKYRSNLWPKAVGGGDGLRLAWQPNGADPKGGRVAWGATRDLGPPKRLRRAVGTAWVSASN